MNYRKASEQIHLSEPSLHHQIKNLEAHLGVTLFAKQGRHLRLTASGNRLIPIAEKIVASYNDGYLEMKLFKEQKASCLYISTYSLFVPLMKKFIPIFIRKNPQIEISMIVNDCNMNECECDIYITKSISKQSQQNVQKIYEYDMKLAVPAGLTNINEGFTKYDIVFSHFHSPALKKPCTSFIPRRTSSGLMT
ncbi:LysR family transcriptional regulator [Fructilactobacillus ixorae]|uniref:LysR family transcriptional regulator n=1 Tax=Fructilactobacillus ixorae TaxID=1750535 RepID=A0ABY5C5I1_9LACO|nr:LysR family transcriptional regulator [Fructilactobacillus ixorae]